MIKFNRLNRLITVLLMAIVITGMSLSVSYGDESQLAKVTFYVA